MLAPMFPSQSFIRQDYSFHIIADRAIAQLMEDMHDWLEVKLPSGDNLMALSPWHLGRERRKSFRSSSKTTQRIAASTSCSRFSRVLAWSKIFIVPEKEIEKVNCLDSSCFLNNTIKQGCWRILAMFGSEATKFKPTFQDSNANLFDRKHKSRAISKINACSWQVAESDKGLILLIRF